MVKGLPPRILVVDDDLSAALQCTYALLDAGFEVDMATTRSDAVRLLAERSYVAFVVDLVMPDLGGRLVIHAIRAVAPQAALVVMGDDPESEARALEPDDYLRRPFGPSGLLDAVARALGRSRGRSAAQPPGRSFDGDVR